MRRFVFILFMLTILLAACGASPYCHFSSEQSIGEESFQRLSSLLAAISVAGDDEHS